MDIQTTIQQAVEAYGAETECLLPVVERRYDRRLFLSTGQYDWFSAQVLYCLVRLVKPQSIVEVSTSSGYSTLVQAIALKKNQSGLIHTFEINSELASAALAVFRQFEVDDMVKIYMGDARVESQKLSTLAQPSILFLDSLHTEDFARWFIDRWVLDAPAGTLFQVHDVMPPLARVRFDDGPPWPTMTKFKKGLRDLGRRFLRRPTTRDLGLITPTVCAPGTTKELPTINGVFHSEAVFINRVVQHMPDGSYAYLYDLIDRYPQLSPHRYDNYALKRQDSKGQPMEWNETVWLACEEFREALGEL